MAWTKAEVVKVERKIDVTKFAKGKTGKISRYFCGFTAMSNAVDADFATSPKQKAWGRASKHYQKVPLRLKRRKTSPITSALVQTNFCVQKMPTKSLCFLQVLLLHLFAEKPEKARILVLPSVPSCLAQVWHKQRQQPQPQPQPLPTTTANNNSCWRLPLGSTSFDWNAHRISLCYPLFSFRDRSLQLYNCWCTLALVNMFSGFCVRVGKHIPCTCTTRTACGERALCLPKTPVFFQFHTAGPCCKACVVAHK